MAAQPWILRYFLIISLFSNVYGIDIQFFARENFTGLIWRKNSSKDNWRECTKLGSIQVASLRADACFVVYGGDFCKSDWSVKYMAGETILSQNTLLGSHQWVKSMHICRDNQPNRNQLNVDIIQEYGSPVLESYKNVCSCVNVPQHVQNLSRWAINNHHNALLAYFEPNCSVDIWTPMFLEAGFNEYSRQMYSFEKTDGITKLRYKIQSIGPDPQSHYFRTSCNSAYDQKLQAQTDRSKQNQEKFESRILQQQQEQFFNKLTDKVKVVLQQGFQNFTDQIKFSLLEMFA